MALAQSLVTVEGKPLSLTLTGVDTDGDRLTFIFTSPPSHGVLSGNPPSLTYTPAANYTGTDSFMFAVSDGHSVSSEAVAVISIAPDSDHDGLSDKWELAAFGSLAYNGTEDPDGDGQDNAFEFISGSAPNDGDDYLILAFAGLSPGNGAAFRLNHVRPGVRYRLEASPDPGSWLQINVATFDTEGPGEMVILLSGTATHYFYRVTLVND